MQDASMGNPNNDFLIVEKNPITREDFLMDPLSDRSYEGLGQMFSTQTKYPNGHYLTKVAIKPNL